MIKVLNYSDISDKDKVLKIFLLTLDKSIKDKVKIESLKYMYFDFYEKYPEYFLVALDQEEILGYICCAPTSIDQPELAELMSHYKKFTEQYEEYPAHLHINCHPESQGMGVGTVLINALCDKLQSDSISAVHLITGVNSRNVEFYKKNKFKKIHKIGNLLLLGKKL